MRKEIGVDGMKTSPAELLRGLEKSSLVYLRTAWREVIAWRWCHGRRSASHLSAPPALPVRGMEARGGSMTRNFRTRASKGFQIRVCFCHGRRGRRGRQGHTCGSGVCTPQTALARRPDASQVHKKSRLHYRIFSSDAQSIFKIIEYSRRWLSLEHCLSCAHRLPSC